MSFFKKLLGGASDSIEGRELVLAAQAGHQPVVQSLLAKGVDVNAQSEHGITALMAASHFGHKDVVTLLLAKGADINARDIDGATALMTASQKGHAEIVNALVHAGANLNLTMHVGKNADVTALHVASAHGRKEVVQALLDRGVDIDTRQNSGETSLWIASEEGHDDVVQTLLERGADVNAQKNDGVSALTAASAVGHTAVVQLLLAKGAHVNARAKNGVTALMLASMNGNKAVVQLLLNAGADIMADGGNGTTAMSLASANGHEEVMALLTAAAPSGTISFVRGRDDRKFHSLKYASPGNVYGHIDESEKGWNDCHAVIVLAEAVSAWYEFGSEDYAYGFRVLDDDSLLIYVEFTAVPRPDRKFLFALSLNDPGHYEWLAFLGNAKRLTIVNGPEGSLVTGLTLQLDSPDEMEQLRLALAHARTHHPHSPSYKESSMSFGTKLFGTGASSSAAEKGRGDSLAAAGMLRVACPACGHESEIPRATPAFGTAVICSRCKASLIRVSDPNERPYSPPREVALFLGYHGCSLLHAHCPWCRKVNYSVVVPERGYSVSFYWNRQQENPNAAFVVNANCAHCGQPYVIEWDEDPR